MQKLFKETFPELIPVSKFNEFIEYPSSSALRQYIFYNTNGFRDKVLRYMGKRQYIDIKAFHNWVSESSNQKDK